jgi:hypothetical protein
MNVYVSWAYTVEAGKAEERLGEWVTSLSKKTKAEKELIACLTPELCLPEYVEFKGLEADAPQLDKLNRDLLSVRFVTPQLGRTVTYQLSKRMAGCGKLPMSLAARSHLLKTFEGEWEYDANLPKGHVTFVGLPGVKDFLLRLKYCCAALGHPFPTCFSASSVLELPSDQECRDVLDAAAYNQEDKADQGKYVEMLTGWMGTGASAARDGVIALTLGLLLGWEGSTDGSTE